MGVLDALRAVETGGTAMRFEDADGRRLMEMPPDFAGGDLEVQRGDLSRVLCEAAQAEMIFGDTVVALDETGGGAGVDVTFRSGRRRVFDLVIGADGVHSTVRRLVFGPEEQFVKHLGYYVAGWDAAGETGWRGFNAPGRMISVSRAGAFVVFGSRRPLDHDRHDRAALERIIVERFGGLGWETPRLLDALRGSADLWFDQICRVDVPRWTKGRVALVGDAASGATIGGQGCGTALVEAYVLAGEINDLPAYQRRVQKFAKGTQKGGDTTGRFLAPRRGYGIRMRNTLHNQPWFMRMTMSIAAERSTDLVLPDYSAASASTDSSGRDGTVRSASAKASSAGG